jgi:catechol 2,3-dioxygenase-like lactoylglutathione lyase family enzyme
MNVRRDLFAAVLLAAATHAAAPAAGGGSTVSEKATPEINVRFVYNFCNDLGETRRFYTDLLGLNEAGYSEEHRYLCYQSEGFRLMFFRPDAELEVLAGWADQPGYEGGTSFVTSWSVEVPEAKFADAVERLRVAGVECFSQNPTWCVDSYWGFYVKDPMGRTVEVYTIPKGRPTSTTWPGK